MDVLDYNGEIIFDTSKPDGMPQKLMCVEKLKSAGWVYKTDLRVGIRKTYEWFLHSQWNR